MLVLVFWSLNWGLDGLRTHLFFFPQWLGYCLVVDALVERRKGTSLISRNPAGYAMLFLVSVPVWWMFEGLNTVTRNWHYLGREEFSDTAYVFLSSIAFSTVIPAVFSTAELLGTFGWMKCLPKTPAFKAGRPLLWSLHAAGWLMLALMLTWPDLFFPFMWLSWVFILDPLNALAGRPSLLKRLSNGNPTGLLAFGLGALCCGFFWELWNIHAYPKWIYTIPYLEVLHIFEMPLAGYGGYVPFGWELFALYQLVMPLIPRKLRAGPGISQKW